jgi:hypothetical protein
MIGTILFYVGFLLLIVLFSEEFVQALAWLRKKISQYPQYRIIAYPLIMLLLLAAGIIIATFIIKFTTTATFSYE